jgi:hypothetical protein
MIFPCPVRDKPQFGKPLICSPLITLLFDGMLNPPNMSFEILLPSRITPALLPSSPWCKDGVGLKKFPLDIEKRA